MLEQKIYSLEEAGQKTNLSAKILHSFCDHNLIPGVKPGTKAPRFDEYDIQWIKIIDSLKHCRMTNDEIYKYAQLFAKGSATIPERKAMLKEKAQELEAEMYELQASLDYINYRQQYYDRILEQDIDGAAEVLLESDMCMF